jgi:hypothetical protein
MKTRPLRVTLLKLLALSWSLAALGAVQSQEFEREPIEYSKRAGENRVT